MNKGKRCGFLLPGGIVIEVPNMAEDKFNSFVMADNDVIAWEAKAFASWHTHPGTTSNLSGEDYVASSGYPALKHIIIGSDGITCYSVSCSGAIIKDETQDLSAWQAEIPLP